MVALEAFSHSNLRELSDWEREGLGAFARSTSALEHNASAPASADATHARWTAARIAERAGLLAERAGLPVDASENASRISLREHALGPICSGIMTTAPARGCCATPDGQTLQGRVGGDLRSVLALYTACDSSSHALTAAGHMRPGTPAGIRKRSTAFKPSPWLNPAPSRTPGYHHASSPNC